jgi:hypothetical protein
MFVVIAGLISTVEGLYLAINRGVDNEHKAK